MVSRAAEPTSHTVGGHRRIADRAAGTCRHARGWACLVAPGGPPRTASSARPNKVGSCAAFGGG